MKKQNNSKLDEFTAWQWELAIVASRFRLGLLSDSEIIAFTHKLMDNGFYDDVMLNIIDDRQIYLSEKTIENFQKILDLFHLPTLTIIDSQYLNTLQRIYPFTQLPIDIEGFLYIAGCDEFYETFSDLINYCSNSSYVDIDEISSIISKLYDDLSFYLQTYITAEQLREIFSDFGDNCTQWLTRNQSKILEIMHQLFL